MSKFDIDIDELLSHLVFFICVSGAILGFVFFLAWCGL